MALYVAYDLDHKVKGRKMLMLMLGMFRIVTVVFISSVNTALVCFVGLVVTYGVIMLPNLEFKLNSPKVICTMTKAVQSIIFLT